MNQPEASALTRAQPATKVIEALGRGGLEILKTSSSVWRIEVDDYVAECFVTETEELLGFVIFVVENGKAVKADFQTGTPQRIVEIANSLRPRFQARSSAEDARPLSRRR